MCDIAWAAGFFDGEGSVSLLWSKRKANKNVWWRLQVTVVNCDRRALERFVEVVGEGRLYTRRPQEGHRTIHYLRSSDAVAERILRRLQSHLVSKKEVVDLALESRELGQRKPYERIPEERWLRLIEIENGIKARNGRSHRKATVEMRDRESHIVIRHTST